MPEFSENAFEQAIESVLVTGRPDGISGDRTAESTPGYGEFIPGGYHRRTSTDYDKDLCLIPQDVLDFILDVLENYSRKPDPQAHLLQL